MDAYFSSTRLSLLDRGFVYAIAHIRGGEDLGRQWYEGGKLKKKNTFKDFIACSTSLDQNILLQHICMLKVDLLVDY
jgi:oligopeptidase B